MSTDIKVPETLEEAQALLKAERETSTKYKERAISAEKLIEKHKPKKYTRDEVEDIKADFRAQIKEHEKRVIG